MTNLTSLDFICKLCGSHSINPSDISYCHHCKIPICKKCRSLGYCLNCWVNLDANSQKMLKLLRFFSWSIPIFLLFTSLYGWLYLILVEIASISLFIGLFYYTRYRIEKKPNSYYNSSWEENIQTENYKKYMDPHFLNRYLNKEIKKYHITQNKEIVEDLNQIPIPKYMEDIIKSEDKILDKSNEIVEDIPDRSFQYQLVNKPCPICEETIHFGDFCPFCNIKFCPNCSEQSNPYNRLCICGFIYPNLQEEYFRWTGNREIEVIKEKKPNIKSKNPVNNP